MDRKRLGLATFLWPGIDVWQWIDLAAELGLGAVEIRAEPRMAHPDELSSHDRRRLRDHLRDSKLRATLHAPIHDLNLASPNPHIASASVAELVASVDLAADLGAEIVVFHPGGLPKEYAQLDGEYERAWGRMEFALAVALPHGKRKGVKLALENKQKGKDDLVLTPEDHLRILRKFPDLGACLDFGHLHTLALNPKASLILGPQLIHVHLSDNRGETDDHLALGEGTLDVASVLTGLESLRYEGLAILEVPDPVSLRRSVDLLAG